MGETVKQLNWDQTRELLISQGVDASRLPEIWHSGINLRGLQLPGGDLRGAHLKEVKLSGCDLHNADLSYANLSGADFHS